MLNLKLTGSVALSLTILSITCVEQAQAINLLDYGQRSLYNNVLDFAQIGTQIR
jgi:hypothetical protein